MHTDVECCVYNIIYVCLQIIAAQLVVQNQYNGQHFALFLLYIVMHGPDQIGDQRALVEGFFFFF